jgi:hypothetical protein
LSQAQSRPARSATASGGTAHGKRGLAAFLWSVERNKRGRDEIQLVEPEN